MRFRFKKNINMSHQLSMQRCLLLILLAFSTFACKKEQPKDKNSNALEVMYTSFKGEVPVEDKISFTFSQFVLDNDSLLNIWIDAPYISFEPAVEGKFRWLNKNELQFAPSSPLPYATAITANLNKSILDLNPQYKKWKGNTQFEFTTQSLQLENAFSAWAKEGSKVGCKITTQFNMPIDGNDLANAMEIKIDGKQYAYEVLDKSYSRTHDLMLSEDPNNEAQHKLEVVLLPTKNFNKQRSKKTATLYPIKELKITKIEAKADGLISGINIYASQKLNVDDLKSKLKITPKINYEIEPTYYGCFLKSNDLKIGNNYKVELKKGLIGELGGKLKKQFTQNTSLGEITPEIKFQNSKAIYLTPAGNELVSVRMVNTPKVKISVYKVFQNNLLHFLNRGKSWDSHYHYDRETRNSEYYDYQYYSTDGMGQLVHEEVLQTDQLPSIGINKMLKINFKDKLADKDGVFVVQIEDEDKFYISDSKLISLSDIGIITKEDKDNIYVFLNSIATAKSMPGVEVSLISTHNQLIVKQTSGSDGIAKFSKSAFTEGFIPRLVTVKNGSDFNYINLSSSRYMTSRYDVGGKREGGANYDLFMYAERGLYRPGEQVHFAGIIRDYDWQLTPKMPINVVLKSPNGKEYATVRTQIDDQGMFTADFNISATSMTGTYHAQVTTGKDIYLGSKSVQVEEFMPDRIKVDIEMDKTEFELGEKIEATILAKNYFGPPAADNNYQLEYTVNRSQFHSKKHSDYNFYLNYQYAVSGDEFLEGKTDAEGKITFEKELKEKGLKNMGTLNARLYATVFDETGRPVHKSKRFKIKTQDVFIGNKYVDRWVGTRKPIAIPLLAVDADENSIAQEVEIEVVQYQWHSTLRYSGGRYRYESQKEEITVEEKEVTIQKNGSVYYFTPKTSGNYEVIVRVPNTKFSKNIKFYAYSYEDTNNSSFEVNNEGSIDISFDKESYKVGEKATAILSLPFDGKVLISTERDNVMSHVYMDSKNKTVRYPITVSDKNVPNTYVSATLIKPHLESGIPLTVAHGFESFTVAPSNGKLDVKIKAAEKSRSKTKQKINIKSKPNAHLTVAVVDEGILAIGNQKTPKPYDYFYAKRALNVESGDLYPYLFPEITATGGDAEMMESEMANRQNPMKNKRVKLVSFWSDILKTDASGNASFEIDIPQFSGSLRIMAVGSKNQMFGSAQQQMVVADPIVISSAIPRFLSMNDEWMMTVNVSNTTDKAAKGKVNISTQGPLTVQGDANATIEIPANSEKEVVFMVKAGQQLDQAKVVASVEALGETFTESTDITIRPAASLEKQYSSGIVKGGQTKTLDFATNFLPSSAKHKVCVSNSPLVQFTEDFDNLVRYPFGCLEQTVSKAFPQLYFEDLVQAVYAEGSKSVDRNEIKRNVQHAIDKIRTMQLSNGGLTYWPNSGNENWWASAYAANFLIEAKAKGYQVNNRMLNKLLDYLKYKLKKKEKFVYYYNGSLKKDIVRKETAYSLYVLALAGQPDVSSMKYYLNHPTELSMDAKYLIASAFIMKGDITSARQLLPGAFQGEKSVPVSGGSFYSYIRDIAISTNALLHAQPNHPQIPDLVKLLSQEMGNKKYLNTQESAFGFMALGKYAEQNPKGSATAQLVQNGKTLLTFDGEDICYSQKETDGAMELKVSGEGSVYYFVESQGIPTDGKVKDRDNYLQVRRTFLNREGKLISNNVFNQNELIVVKITLKSLTGKRIENVAVTDILPAGLEIENARITEMPDLDWVNASMKYDHRDIRDDRIHFFTTASASQKTFYYLTRAVTPGNYQLGPVSADAMYNGEYHSYYGSGEVVVQP